MANKSLFSSLVGQQVPLADTTNEAGGRAYKLAPELALAQYAMTGCMNTTFYASAADQLRVILELGNRVSPSFIARLAVYSRESGYMKDIPALLCAILSVRDPKLLEQIFPRVIDNGKMLRNFVQIIRSGVIGRKSLGSLPKRLVSEWLAKRSEEELFRASVGNAPSLADVIKMVHPKPTTPERAAFYGYLLGKEHQTDLLPELVREYEAFKAKTSIKVPAVPFQMLTSLSLEKTDWKEIACNAKWQMTRMNLNTFLRHGVFEDLELVDVIAKRLANADEIRKARAFPYQLLMAFSMAGGKLPEAVRKALQDAMEIAVENVPEFSGRVVVCPDVSGSMKSPVTGFREGSSSAVRCIDVAALMAAAARRKNSSAIVLPFEYRVIDLSLDREATVMTNAQRLGSIGGGGTDCSAPLAYLNKNQIRADLIILVSDNESWVRPTDRRGTKTMEEWEKFRVKNPKARLVCLDIQPYDTSQAPERTDILNIGGFSDQVFEVIKHFSDGKLHSNHFVGLIDSLKI